MTDTENFIEDYKELKRRVDILERTGGVSLTSAQLPVGSVIGYGSSVIPAGFLLCDGSAVSRTDYAALFAVIGEDFGAGDSSTTFNLPDQTGSPLMDLNWIIKT